MAARNGIILTRKQIAAWREEDARLESEITERAQRRADLRRKLEAAEILEADFEDADTAEPEADSSSDSQEDGESVAVALVADMRKTGASIKVAQVRQKLAALGFPEHAEKRNYVYGLLFRLVKSGKLLKRGAKYRAAPISSPEGETEAVGASARH